MIPISSDEVIVSVTMLNQHLQLDDAFTQIRLGFFAKACHHAFVSTRNVMKSRHNAHDKP
jgi:hypothetical protein